MSQSDVLVYDVTGASEGFKKFFGSKIVEIEAKQIIERKKPNTYKGSASKITTILPLTGIYGDLTLPEKISLGSDFVNIENIEGNLGLTSVIRKKELGEKTHLRLGNCISPELYEKISPELIELIELENGLYQSIEEVRKMAEKKEI